VSSRFRRIRPKRVIPSRAGIRRWLAATVFVAAALACTGCTSFEHPIVAETGPALDEALIGRWSCSEERGTLVVDITRDGDAGHVSLTVTEKGKDSENDEGRLITARLERLTFASIGTGNGDGGQDWTLVRYELHAPDRLSIYLDNERFWKDAVRNKLVSGELRKGAAGGTAAAVTASSDEMRKVVLGYGSVIFDDSAVPCEFTRSTP